MLTALDNIHIVLVEITHPGNIGAAARAMKNMGLSKMVLVKPKIFPSAQATERAAGACDILANAKIYETFEESVAECKLVIGTSARQRSLPLPNLTPTQCAETALNFQDKTAIVFGRERSGLKNIELNQCHQLVQIPTNPDFSSLNIAAAVQVISYELYSYALENQSNMTPTESSHLPVDTESMQRFYTHLQQTLFDIDFLDPAKSNKLMQRLHRLFNRAQPNDIEMNILRGILTAAQRQAAQLKKEP